MAIISIQFLKGLLYTVTFWIFYILRVDSATIHYKFDSTAPTPTSDPWTWYFTTEESYAAIYESTEKECGKFMKLAAADETDPNNVACRCLKAGLDRPLVYWKNSDSCYRAFEQGPCDDGEWLVPRKQIEEKEDPIGECQKNPCPTSVPDKSIDGWVSSGETARLGFYFTYNGICYQTETKAFCDDHQVVFFNGTSNIEPTCDKPENLPVKLAPKVGFSAQIPCPPGSLPQSDSKCAKIVSFS